MMLVGEQIVGEGLMTAMSPSDGCYILCAHTLRPNHHEYHEEGLMGNILQEGYPQWQTVTP